MIVILGLMGIFGTIVFCTVVVGISLHDIREIRRTGQRQKHPYAQRYRRRPLVSIRINGKLTEQKIRDLLKNNNYRKLEIITSSSQQIRGEFILTTNGSVPLQKNSIRHAVIELMSRPALHSLEIPVPIVRPGTLRELFAVYHQVAGSLFRKSRDGLGIYLPDSKFLLLARSSTPRSSIYDKLYAIFAALAPQAILFTGGLAIYMLLVLHQATPLAVILGSLGLFMAFAIWWCDQLGFMQKLGYSVLMPISLWYFIAVTLRKLLKILTDMSKAVFHGRIGLFMRVKDILRIVE